MCFVVVAKFKGQFVSHGNWQLERQKEARFVGELRWHTNILQFIQDELYIVVQP